MKRIIALLLAVCLALSLGVPALAAEETTDPTKIYAEIQAAEHITLDDAWEQLGELESEDVDVVAFQLMMADLRRCQGRFIQTGDDTGNTYTADVEFYFSGGDTYCTVDYTNYGGELDDGQVGISDELDYLFESHPKGSFFSREQDFSIHFSEEKLHIQWASTCDYILDRGSGAVDATVTRKETFPESDLYQTFSDTLDEVFKDTSHCMVYDADKDLLTVYVGMDIERSTLVSNSARVADSWAGFTDTLTKLNNGLLTARRVGDFTNSRHCYLYVVDYLDADNEYGPGDYLLCIEDDEVVYNFMDDVQGPGSAVVKTPSGGSSSKSAGTKSSGSSSSAATSGQRNALARAKDYLDYMAFSYSGLVEQLEYEGYTHSEAVYGADHCGADWYEQAVQKAKDYLDYMSFSRSDLIEQLEYEGFTPDQAVYGVEQAY